MLLLLTAIFLSQNPAKTPAPEPAPPPEPETIPQAPPKALSLWLQDQPAPTQDTADDDPQVQQLKDLHEKFLLARRVFGDSHVLLTALGYYGRKNKENLTGVAGAITVPLFGAGGGYGADGWPVLHTQDEAVVFADVERRLRAYSDTLDAWQKEGAQDGQNPAALKKRFAVMADIFEDLLLREEAALDGDKNGCGPHKAEAENWIFPEPKSLRQCLNALRAGEGSAEAKLKMLDALWQEHRRLRGDMQRTRHAFLIGPTVALSLNQTEQVLVGGLAEFGGTHIRFTVAGGIMTPRENPFWQREGFWVGIGMSGQYGDDLFNLLRQAALGGL